MVSCDWSSDVCSSDLGVAPGKKLLLSTNNDYAYRVALDWLDAGQIGRASCRERV